MMKMYLKRVVLALPMLLLSAGVFAQAHDVKGKVLDEEQMPIPGANVIVKGTTNGTITAGNGEFLMKAADGDVLQISYMGYVTEEVTVAGEGPYNVSMAPDLVGLEEVVVVGYGVQKKSDVTGAIASVKAEDLERRSSTSAVQAMQGKAAGVTILNSSAAPGAGSDIRVRGYSSNSGNISPLLIVDGLKVENIQYLDPSMIESMEILKDAASAAIYGAEAGNGVVLITTKSGSKQDGKIFYNYQYTQSKLGKRAEMMNAKQYINWNTEAGQIDSLTLYNTYNYVDGTDTDWADVIFGTGVMQRHTFGAQGGNERGSYYAAITNVDDNGMVKGNKDVYKRLSAQINADYNIKKWFSVSSNISIEKWSRKSLGEHSEYGGANSIFMSTTVLDPLTPVYYSDSLFPIPDEVQKYIDDSTNYVIYGDNNGYYAASKLISGDAVNPLVARDRADNKQEGFNIRGTLSADIKPFKGFVFTSRLGYRITQTDEKSYSTPYYYNNKNLSPDYDLSTSTKNGYYYQWENFANYNKSFGEHNVGGMVGMSYSEEYSLQTGGELNGPNILKSYEPNFLYLEYDSGDEAGRSKKLLGGTPSESASMSYFGRLSWGYADRYNLQVNFRADAFDSSKLAGSNRWGKFPSVSAGWTISKEDFLVDALSTATISYLKLRGSWGQNGNISVLQNYPYSTTVSLNSRMYQFDAQTGNLAYGSTPDGLANPDLKWETSEQIDLGLDGRLLNDKLSFAIDWYKKTTKDLLVPVAPPREVGVLSTTINAGEVENMGFEFELGWKDKIGDFSYSINANVATLKNKVTYLDQSIERIEGAKFASHTLRTYVEEDHPIWYMRGFDYAGVNENGEALFYTANGETTTEPTIADQKDLGQGIPKVTYGLTINLEYKNFDFTVFGSGIAGNKIYACNYRTQHTLINGMELFYKDRSTINPDGTLNIGKYPTTKNMYQNTNFYSSSANLFNGSYFKIKQIQLGYTIPRELTNKLYINSFRVYVALDDFFTFTKYKGFDPETASNGTANSIGFDKGSYPTSRKMTFGLNLTF